MAFLNIRNLHTDIKKIDKKLLKRVAKGKITENFGQADVRKLEDKYFELLNMDWASRNMLRTFSEYCSTIESQGTQGFFDSTAWTGKTDMLFDKAN
mgnify:FL=1